MSKTNKLAETAVETEYTAKSEAQAALTEQDFDRMSANLLFSETADLQCENRKLHEQAKRQAAELKRLSADLERTKHDLDSVSDYLYDITALQVSDLRNFLNIIPNCVMPCSSRDELSTVLNAAHELLDKIEHDIELLQEQNFDELAERHAEQAEKVLRGCQQ